jgi:RND family efflux transporter MFP subunit
MLSLAQQRLEDTVIKAPFDGLVQERHVGRGSFVQIGEPIVTLVRTGKLRFRGFMPERHAHRLAIGEQLTLRIEGADAALAAKVTRISPSVDESSRSLAFEAEVDNTSGILRTGLFAQAEVVVDPNARAILIPPSAVTEFAGTEKVWKVVEGVAREQIVQTAHRGEKEIEIIRGLAAGDQILLDATQGQIARIDPTPSAAEPTLTSTTANIDSAESDPTETSSP